MRTKMILTLGFACVAILFAAGCTDKNLTMEQQNADFDRKVVIAEKLIKVADDQGIAWQISVELDGSPNVYEKVELGLDTGIRLKFNAAGNAQSEANNED